MNTFIDGFSRYTKIYLQKNKDETGQKFLINKIEVENQFTKKIKKLRTNRGGEYNANMLSAFCENHGIIHEVTSPYCVAERKDRTLKNMVNAMLTSSKALLNLWGKRYYLLVMFKTKYLIRKQVRHSMNCREVISLIYHTSKYRGVLPKFLNWIPKEQGWDKKILNVCLQGMPTIVLLILFWYYKMKE